MDKINIKTWNINWFRGINSGHKYLVKEQKKDVYISIVKNIKEFLVKENSVVILQEVPYKNKNQYNNWEINSFYTELLEDFPTHKYEIISNIKKNSYVVRGTFAIFNKGEFTQMQTASICKNRIIELEKKPFTIIGVHMPALSPDSSIEDREMWDELIKYINEYNCDKKMIILGDFNCYEECKNKLTEVKFMEVCKKANAKISDDIPTFIGKTTIDHVFAYYDIGQNYLVSIQDEFDWSDHKYIDVEIKTNF